MLYTILACPWNAPLNEMHRNPLFLSMHCDTKTSKIYRFAPGSNVQVSIDCDSFKRFTDAQRKFLRRGLQLTLFTINEFNLVITFQYVEHKRGLVELEYKGHNHSTWAISEFPVPGRDKYTIGIYSKTFNACYGPAIVSILSHEVDHILGMRHHHPHPGEPVSVWHGGNDAKSIMGVFVHPADLYFRGKDVAWLRKFYSEPEGGFIGGKSIQNVNVPT